MLGGRVCMKASRIVKGLRAIGVDDATICDFINYYAYGTSFYFNKLLDKAYAQSEQVTKKILEYGELEIEKLNEHTLALISNDADIKSGVIFEAEIHNIDNPTLDGIYRYESVSYVDKYGAEYYGKYLYKNSRYLTNDNRSQQLNDYIKIDAELDLYNDERFLDCSEEDRDYYICSLVWDKAILKNPSVREFCKIEEIYL